MRNRTPRAPGRGRIAQNRHAVNMQPRIQRSTLNRSHRVSTTLDTVGVIYPVALHEILPGDTVKLSVGGLVRLATPIHPILDDVVLDIHVFFAQDRNLWDNALKFYGEQDDLSSPQTFLQPTITSASSTHGTGSIFDYYGIPIGPGGLGRNGIEHKAIPIRGYHQIHEDWYRHQELAPKYGIDKGDGPDSPLQELRFRNRRYDYFSAALTSPQRGDAPELNIGGQAPLVGNPLMQSSTVPPTFDTTIGSGFAPNELELAAGAGTVSVDFTKDTGTGSGDLQFVETGLSADLGVAGLDGTGAAGTLPFADLSTVSGFTINDLRDTIAIQHFLEAEARGGSRYAELVDVFFGVNFPDRLYRTQYLGGGTIPITVHQVPQTSNTISSGGDASAQGNLAAYGQGVGITRPVVFSSVEHGFIHVLVSARRSAVTYQDGLHRQWSRSTRFEHYWPQFAFLGEEGISSREIYADGTAGDDDVWGYIPRWDSYRYGNNIVTGKMRSNASGTLHSWNLADSYSSRPVLNEEWMKEQPDIARVIAVTDEPDLLAEFAVSLMHTRPMPVHSIPGLSRF